MRVRKLTAVAAATLASALVLGGLTACETKVGVAAIVAGHRISESQVTKYLTAKAAPVAAQTQTGDAAAFSPRAFVLRILIAERLYDRVLILARSRPSEGDLARVTTQALKGATPAQVSEKSGVHGYTAEFDRLWVRAQILLQTLNNAAQNGVDLKTVIDKLHFPVSVNPRYGTWDKKTLDLSTDAGAGVPDFLKLGGPSLATAPPGASN